jgi:uncharacterized membrane protein
MPVAQQGIADFVFFAFGGRKARLRSELDYDVNRRAEAEIRHLADKIRRMDDKIDDVTDLLRSSRA